MANLLTRRLALFRIGAGSAAAAVATTAAVTIAAPKPEIEESPGHFKTPLEYLLAMQSIGWTPRAMFQRLEDGGVHCMGVNESAPDQEWVMKTWRKFHAISMRCPVQRADDLPPCDWWKEVWQFLYDRGLRKDVTLDRADFGESLQ